MKVYNIIRIIFAFLILANSHANSDEQAVIEKLQADIKTSYIPKLISTLGLCPQGDCLELDEIEDFLILKTSNDEICLPFTSCGFYRCMENKYQCLQEGVNYFTHLALPTCSKYKENISKNYFSKDGINWIYNVMVCLQKGLVDECEVKGNCNQKGSRETCDYITKFTLDFHPGCYINSGIGVCKLPMKDKISIWKTVSQFLTKEERKQAYKVVFHCLNPIKSRHRNK